MNNRLKFVVIILVVGFAVSAQAQEKKIRRDQLPPAVERTVATESAGATIKGFATEVEHGQRLYEMTLDVNGHSKDVVMDKDGNVVEVEEEVNMDSLPASVQAALKKASGNGTINQIESLTKKGAVVAYEAQVKHGNKRSEIQVGPNGEKLKRPE